MGCDETLAVVPPDAGDDGHACAASFHRRMASAARCPIRGPCPECASSRAHYCILGEAQRRGRSLEGALGDALVALAWKEGGIDTLDLDARHLGKLLGELCREHTRVVRRILARRASSDVRRRESA